MKSQEFYPLVSCLCLTSNKVSRLKKSIRCFEAQTYPNKEMVILYKDDDFASKEYLQEFDRENIHVYEIPANSVSTLGDLRNISLQKASGEYFCTWDDDDYSHQDRLLVLMDSIINSHHDASMLTNVIIYDENEQKAYFSAFRLWEQTLVCKMEKVSEVTYPPMNRGEDSVFVNGLFKTSKIYPTVAANLYIYIFHRKNVSGTSHFQSLIELGQALPDSVSEMIADIVEFKYDFNEAAKLLNSETFLQEVNYFARKSRSYSVSGSKVVRVS